MRALSPRAREAALVAAALSRPTVATVVAALGAQDEAEAAIVEAEEAGIIVAERARIRFAHPLLASAVYAAASHERRRQLHRRLAGVVSDPEERARHLAESATHADAATAAEIEQAADRAARRGAQDAAAQLYGAAARLTPDECRDDAARRMLGEAAALFAAGDPKRRSSGGRDGARTRRGSDPPRRGERSAERDRVGREPRTSASRLPRTRPWPADGDRRLCGRIHAKLSEASLLDQRKALAHAEAATALLDEDEDPALLAHALIDKLFFGAQLGWKAPRAVLERALRLEERAGPNEQRSRMPLMWFAWMDELEAARARHAFEDAWYRDRGEEGWRAERLGQLALRRAQCGQLGGGRADDRGELHDPRTDGAAHRPVGNDLAHSRYRRPPSRPNRTRERDAANARRGLRTDGSPLLRGGLAERARLSRARRRRRRGGRPGVRQVSRASRHDRRRRGAGPAP